MQFTTQKLAKILMLVLLLFVVAPAAVFAQDGGEAAAGRVETGTEPHQAGADEQGPAAVTEGGA